MLGLNSIEAGKLLHLMVEKGLLNQNNKNRWTTYTILKKLDFENGEEKSEEKSEEKKVVRREGGRENGFWVVIEKTIKPME